MKELAMQTLATRPVAPDIELARLESDLARRWPQLQPAIVLDWSEELRLILDGDTPWVFGPAERDPMRGRDGRALIPRRQRAQLAEIASWGVPFQRISIAHEAHQPGPLGEHPPTRPGAPCTISDDVARRLVGRPPVPPGLSRVARVGRTLERLLDPIVFGVITPTEPRPGEVSLWFPLAAWRW
jgi:hypothetical protein